MSVRPPQSLRQSQQNTNGFNVLEYELTSERADTLGRHGQKVEAALAALRAWTTNHQSDEERERLLNAASDAVWAFFIQREICGLRNNRDAIQRYGIPNEVIARLGAVPK
ncbi:MULTISPECIES: DUF6665 family protein [unclassified Rhizobium]|uniref:DUF6665 family protein n=1 Tax=unclassified Rhizobium TaxID=2613769 RepID=UPI001C835191|nr:MULTISPECIES: DUF6665 family protein [unclassified Rhizobium]MBX5162075.1 hypothetical protein [Rhizobium sp. NZLR4b]MBX5206296.1 hypothetical protein [Rhizobium sp. NZLR11]